MDQAAILRNAGWMVGTHHDRMQDGVLMTFWLFLHADGQCVTGEGESDQAALNQCVNKAAKLGLIEG